MEFRPFGSIPQFKSVIKSVNDYSKINQLPLPVLTFHGSVKLHGTNGCVGFNCKTGKVELVQSRERVITPEDDNYGFAHFIYSDKEVQGVFKDLCSLYPTAKQVYFYGEWCGKGIQSGVALSQLNQKIFVIFEMVVDEVVVNIPAPLAHPRIFTKNEFLTYVIDIDFNKAVLSQNQLVELTMSIEKQCPVGVAFGVEGTGEGIVWVNKETGLKFKVKGEKHSTSKVKTLKEIAAVDFEKIAAMSDFIDGAVSINRLEQGKEKLKERGLDPESRENTGEFIRWVVTDILKEEADTISVSCFDHKLLTRDISIKARNYYFK